MTRTVACGVCGICGRIAIHGTFDPDPAPVKAMVSAIAHRGPDHRTYLTDAPIHFGHARLSIIDRAGGIQPFTTKDGSVTVTFNGEIFNYRELRKELEKAGARFRTESDTEVLAEAFYRWDTAAFERFNGQWAVAIWDRRRRCLTLSRDRVGIRPLYYAWSNGTLLFASEIKAILTDRNVPRAPSPLGIQQCIAHWGPVAPETAFRSVKQLEPGSYWTIPADGKGERRRRFWQADFAVNRNVAETGAPRSPDERTEELEALLTDAVRLRFSRSDVPVGVYMSGGLDSSLMAALLKRTVDRDVSSFTIGFTDPEYDEREYAALAADYLGLRSHVINATPDKIAGSFERMVRHAEQPVVRSAPAPLMLLSALARERGYVVVLTGEGADEFFGGYDLYREALLRERIARGEPVDLDAAATSLYPWMKASPAGSKRLARNYLSSPTPPDDPYFSHRNRWNTVAAVGRLFSPEWQRAIGDLSALEGALGQALPGSFERLDVLDRAQIIDVATLLPGYILAPQGDRMLMANGVEGRFPFLDHRVIELAMNLPQSARVQERRDKVALRRIAARVLPATVTDRAKQPYRAPDVRALAASETAAWIREVAGTPADPTEGMFNGQAVRAFLGSVNAIAEASNAVAQRLSLIVSAFVMCDRFVRRDIDCSASAIEPISPLPVNR